MKAGGIILIVVAVLLLGITLFFGYFSWANFGSAGRLATSLPQDAQFVIDIVRNKAQNQAMIAGGSFIGFFIFVIPGAVLLMKGKNKNQNQLQQGALAGY